MARSSRHRISGRKPMARTGTRRRVPRLRLYRGESDMKRIALLSIACALATSAVAQVDFSGDWDHPGMFGHEDVPDRGAGPEIGDFMGLPLNAAELRKAEAYSGSWLDVPEHQCTPHP